MRCSRTEVLAESGPVDEFCKQHENLSNQTKNVQQCYCKDGYKRSDWGNCIPESKCLERSKNILVKLISNSFTNFANVYMVLYLGDTATDRYSSAWGDAIDLFEKWGVD